MRKLIKGILRRIAPQWTMSLLSARARVESHRCIALWGSGPVVDKLIGRFGNRVREGLFAGLILTPMTLAEQLGPYLLGLYESELEGAWNIVFRGSYAQVIDIGARFGYYAVGLARRYPQASVVAFDTDWWARKATRKMAAANGTGNVEVRGFCTPAWLERHTREDALILSDCEGYEAVLFQPGIIPRLRSATLIIETHEVYAPGVTNRLREVFGQTHRILEIGQETARRTTSLDLDFLTDDERRLATREVRTDQSWLLCLPRTGPNATVLA